MPADAVVAIAHRATVGTSGPLSWGAGWHPNGLARDLRPDEDRGATWTSEPLGEPLSTDRRPGRGAPPHGVDAGRDLRRAPVRGRARRDASALVATGVLNLTHRLSDTDPSPMPTRGLATEAVRIPLRTTGYRFPPGAAPAHGAHVAVARPVAVAAPGRAPRPCRSRRRRRGSSSRSCPTPRPPSTRRRSGPSRVVMRDVGSSEEDPPEWRIEEDVIRGTTTVTIFDGAASTQEDGSRLYASERLVLTASDPDPARARLGSDVVYRVPATAGTRTSARPVRSRATRARSTSGSPSTSPSTASRSSTASGGSRSRGPWSRPLAQRRERRRARGTPSRWRPTRSRACPAGSTRRTRGRRAA